MAFNYSQPLAKRSIESNCFETLCSHDISLLRKVTKNVFTSHLNLHLLQSLFNLRLSLQLREGGRAAFYWIHWILDVAAVPDLPSHPSSLPFYRTQVRSYSTHVTHLLTHSLTHELVEDLMNWPLLMKSNMQK